MDFIDQSPLLASLNYAKGQVLSRLGVRSHHSGATAYHMSAERSVHYVQQVVEDYVRYGASGNEAAIEGADILEIGPGDNLGVALLLLSLGAASVTCVDGFNPLSSEMLNSRLYSALVNGMSDAQKRRVADAIVVHEDGNVTVRSSRLTVHYGVPIERKHPAFIGKKYSIILSRAVLEHLGNLEAAWENMVDCLAVDGEMWHKVDFRSHKFFSQIHPLYFLTVRDRLWRMVSQPDPTLNRERLPAYRRLLSARFKTWDIYYTSILEEPEIVPHVQRVICGEHYSSKQLESVRAIRPSLRNQFQDYSDEELLISGVFVRARHRLERLQSSDVYQTSESAAN